MRVVSVMIVRSTFQSSSPTKDQLSKVQNSPEQLIERWLFHFDLPIEHRDPSSASISSTLPPTPDHLFTPPSPRRQQLSSSTLGSVVERVETDQLIRAWQCLESKNKNNLEYHSLHSQQPHRIVEPSGKSITSRCHFSRPWLPLLTRKTSRFPSPPTVMVRVNVLGLPLPTPPAWQCPRRSRPVRPRTH